jgi:hypothetical protein
MDWNTFCGPLAFLWSQPFCGARYDGRVIQISLHFLFRAWSGCAWRRCPLAGQREHYSLPKGKSGHWFVGSPAGVLLAAIR